MDLKRKIYTEISKWKSKGERKALIIEGLRQIGKSYIVEKFAKENYSNVFLFDFRKYKAHRDIFKGEFDLNAFKEDLFVLFHKPFDDENAVLVFDEIGDSADARGAIKYILKETRFDIIATGSLLGVKGFKNKANRSPSVGSSHIIEMFPLDFEEFLWANDVPGSIIEEIRQGCSSFAPINEAHHEYLSKLFRFYILTGGMPEAVMKFVSSHDFNEVIDTNIDKLKELEGDFGRVIDENGNVKIDESLLLRTREVYDSLISQLAKPNTKFMFSLLRKGARSKEYEAAITWLCNAGIVVKCHNLSDTSRPLSGNIMPDCYKLYYADIGLYVAAMGKQAAATILNGSEEGYGGYIYEGIAADALRKANIPLCYSDNNKSELDFVLEENDGVAILEVKKGDGQAKSAKAVIEGKSNRRADRCYKVRGKNFAMGSYFYGIPHYALPFLLAEKKAVTENALQVELPKL